MICPLMISPAVCLIRPLIIYRRTPVRYLTYQLAPARAAGGGAPTSPLICPLTSRLTSPLTCPLTSRPPCPLAGMPMLLGVGRVLQA